MYKVPKPSPPPEITIVYEISEYIVDICVYEIGIECIPGSYACASNPATGASGWATCDKSGHYVYTCDCTPSTTCGMLGSTLPICWPFNP
ncbi:hypothetical protein HJFPF1_04297 [Paramyrothecium foliicola]|nr:hypothetical protein HJFPF1_04297 [Paramyrothecium foliicola]